MSSLLARSLRALPRVSAARMAPVRAAQHARAFSIAGARMAKFAKSHEWANADGGIATVGISDHAQGALGDIVFVELPEVGDIMEVGKTIAAVESVKAAADVYSPVAGEIIEVNSKLADEPDTINKEAESGGWIAKVKMSNPGDMDALMDTAAYAKHLEEADH